jgi:hypothetical protein
VPRYVPGWAESGARVPGRAQRECPNQAARLSVAFPCSSLHRVFAGPDSLEAFGSKTPIWLMLFPFSIFDCGPSRSSLSRTVTSFSFSADFIARFRSLPLNRHIGDARNVPAPVAKERAHDLSRWTNGRVIQTAEVAHVFLNVDTGKAPGKIVSQPGMTEILLGGQTG